jgi:hypothetical protein
MPASDAFHDLPVLGRLRPEQAAAKLRELGEDDAAEALNQSRGETRGLAIWQACGSRRGFGLETVAREGGARGDFVEWAVTYPALPLSRLGTRLVADCQ